MAVITKKSDFGDFIFVFFYPTHLDVLFFNRIVGSSPIHTFSEEKNSVFTHSLIRIFLQEGVQELLSVFFVDFKPLRQRLCFLIRDFPLLQPFASVCLTPLPSPNAHLVEIWNFWLFRGKNTVPLFTLQYFKHTIAIFYSELKFARLPKLPVKPENCPWNSNFKIDQKTQKLAVAIFEKCP